MLNEAVYYVSEEEIEYTSCFDQFDIPKKYLTMEIIEDIQRVNERLMV